MCDDKSNPNHPEHPHEVVFGEVAWGRDYRLNDLPRGSDGVILYAGRSEQDFDAYVAWLADFLYSARLAPGARQLEVCRHIERMTPDGAMHGLYFTRKNGQQFRGCFGIFGC